MNYSTESRKELIMHLLKEVMFDIFIFNPICFVYVITLCILTFNYDLQKQHRLLQTFVKRSTICIPMI